MAIYYECRKNKLKGGVKMREMDRDVLELVYAAELIAEHEFGDPENFDYTFEALYKTPSGNYFIFGEGGPLTFYAKRVGPTTKTGGWDIIPLSAETALEWCEDHEVDPGIMEKEFGNLIRKA